jgi:hypothetical protein
MRLAVGAVVAMAGLAGMALLRSDGAAQERGDLRRPSAFAGVSDTAARSRALFSEAAKVITHPRCMNCHPAGDQPLQSNDQHLHQPPVTRGTADAGVPGNMCGACHGEKNFEVIAGRYAAMQSIPGHPRWHLAPIEMAWEGKSVGDICRQLKDRQRNGGRDLKLVHEHAAHDDLVAWGWQPGKGRDPAPGSQEIFGQLIEGWIATGAECP